jgi:hypothetical protein
MRRRVTADPTAASSPPPQMDLDEDDIIEAALEQVGGRA